MAVRICCCWQRELSNVAVLHLRNDQNNAGRTFPMTSFVMSGVRLQGHSIRCSSADCSNVAELPDRKGLPTHVIERKFKQRGWHIGKTEKHDVCKDCLERRRLAARNGRTPVANTAKPAAAKVQALGDLDKLFAPKPAAPPPQPRLPVPSKLVDSYNRINDLMYDVQVEMVKFRAMLMRLEEKGQLDER